MKIIISLIFILGIIHANGQNSNYILNEERTPICINGKESYEYKDKINNRIDRYINLMIEELRQTQTLDLCCSTLAICCDTLKIISFSLASKNCTIDFTLKSKSNLFTKKMKSKFNKEFCKNMYFENIKAKGKSGKMYNLLPVQIIIMDDFIIPGIESD